MTFLIDENIPKSVAVFLENHGHTVIDIRGSDQEGMTDREIFRIAQEQKAIFLTTDRDFYHTIHLTERPHKGIVVITLSKPNGREILEKVKWFLQFSTETDITDKCLVLKDSKATMYS